mmetsp:Transcript_1735/g.4442  ORF Transcript_1735/g.4442 Transcript_1735/m.4442 type:complete len:238 (-) Transcript_1735:48-761(-)
MRSPPFRHVAGSAPSKGQLRAESAQAFPGHIQEVKAHRVEADADATQSLHLLVRAYGLPDGQPSLQEADLTTSEASSSQGVWTCRPTEPQTSRRQRHSKLQIATSLRELQDEDPNCVLVVRRIGKLGFSSLDYVKEHFLRFGPVLKVLGSNQHERDPTDKASVRLRPSGIAFVLMQNASDAAKAFAQGEDQLIHNHWAQVRRFEQRQPTTESQDLEPPSGVSSASSAATLPFCTITL